MELYARHTICAFHYNFNPNELMTFDNDTLRGNSLEGILRTHSLAEAMRAIYD